VRGEKAAEGMREKSERRRGACTQVLVFQMTVYLPIVVLPGKRRLHRRERLYVCRERDPLGLSAKEYISIPTPHSISKYIDSTNVS